MQNFKNKLFISSIIIGSIFLVLFLRLFYLQIVRGDEFEKFSKENRIRLINDPAPRGRILDRNGNPIVINRPSFDIKVFPHEIEDVESLSLTLSELIDLDNTEIRNLIEAQKKENPYLPFILIRDIKRDTLAKVETNKPYLKGITIEVNYLRNYPDNKLGSLFIGYLGKPSKKDLSLYPVKGFGTTVGKTGIEKTYENTLRGSSGINYKVIDALGREVKSKLYLDGIKDKGITPGNDIYLTIDYRLQKVAEQELKNKIGSVSVVNVNTGEILALASSPSFDPEEFVNGIDKDKWDELTSDSLNPLLNRSTQGTYAPGSTFKIVTALAALKEGAIDTDTTFYCPGYYKMGRSRFRCWKHVGHGWLDLHGAIAKSCDVYFYNAAEKLGIEKLSKYSRMFGFGTVTGIEISEKQGLVPTKSWKYKNFKEPWYKGETVIAAIGQGYLNVTPLQVTMMTAAVANGGILFKPQLINKINTNNGKWDQIFSPVAIRRLPFDDEEITFVQNSLVAVVNENFGTGRRARVKYGTVAGKTGTAQVVSSKLQTSKFGHMDHAWFTAYYPAENPQIALTVLVEHGGKGGSVAAPIAKKLIESYIKISKGGVFYDGDV